MEEDLKTKIMVISTILLFLFIGIAIGLINHDNWIHPLIQPTEDAEDVLISNEDYEFLQEAKKYNLFDYRQIYATGKTTRPIIDVMWYSDHDANELFETYINTDYCIKINDLYEWKTFKCSYGKKYWWE